MNNDGAVEFSFWSSGMLCTADVPTSGCGWPFYVRTSLANEVLMNGNDVSPQLLGERLCSEPPTNGIWNIPGGFYGAGVSLWWYSLQGRDVDGQLLHSGWSGGVAEVGVGYLGVRFNAADGLHYGWIRMRLPRGGLAFQPLTENPSAAPVSDQPVLVPLELAPVVVDWAYETRPDSPIRAGDIDSTGDSRQFTVEFLTPQPRSRHPAQVLGTGSLILTGNTLRGELTLAGQFSTAQILDPDHPRGKGRLVSDFGPPLVSTTTHTAFFHDATLTRSQVVQLLHGRYVVSVGDGALEARIVPAPAIRRSHEGKH